MDNLDFHGFEDSVSDRLSITPPQLNGRIKNEVASVNSNSRQARIGNKNVNCENEVVMSKHNGVNGHLTENGVSSLKNEDNNVENIKDGFLGFDNDHWGSNWIGWDTSSSIKLEQLTRLVEKKQNYGINLNRILSQSNEGCQNKKIEIKECTVNVTRM